MAKIKFSTAGYTFQGVQDMGRVYATCANCGQGIRYVAHFINDTTGEKLFLGDTCVLNTTTQIKKEFDFAKTMARVAKKRELFFEENPKARTLYDLVEANPTNYSGYGWSAWNSLKYRGYLNYKQIEMLNDFLTKQVA